MFFTDHCSLDGEFDALYASLFEKSEQYIRIVEALSSKNKGLTRDELLAATKMNNNGHFSVILQDLVDCDFIRSYRGYGNTSKNIPTARSLYLVLFQVYQEIRNVRQVVLAVSNRYALTRYLGGAGFRQVCLLHHQNIESALGISGIMTQTFSWISAGDSKERAQVDLVIKRSDKVVNLCEMKFYEGEYEVRKRDYEAMDRRVRLFRQSVQDRITIHPVLVTTYGLKRNEYSSIFQNVVTLSDFFETR